MSERFKAFRGFVNPILRGKKSDVPEDTADKQTHIAADTKSEEIVVDAPTDEAVKKPTEVTEESESDREPDPEAVKEFFEKFDEEYRKLQKAIVNEVSDCREMYLFEKRQADKYRDIISARDVLEVILPFLTEMKTEIDGLTDIDTFKQIFAYRYKALVKLLDKKGVKLLTHDRGQKVELTNMVRVSVTPTDDIALDDTAGELEQIGCIIKGEEDNPIIEKVQLYQFDESLVKKEPEPQCDTDAETTTDTNEAVSTYDTDNDAEYTVADTDADARYILRFNENRTLNLIRPLFIRLEDNTVIPLIDENAELPTERLKPISPDGADGLGRCECTFILGDEVLITRNISNLEFYAGLITENSDVMLVLYSDLAYRTNGSPIIKYKIGKDLIKMPKY